MKKRKRGRPSKFTSREELQDAVDDYFAYADEQKWPYLIEDLAVHLGMTRETVIQYGKKDNFSDIIKAAKQKIFADLTRRTLTGKVVPVGGIFILKANAGYKESQLIEMEHSGEITIKDGLTSFYEEKEEEEE